MSNSSVSAYPSIFKQERPRLLSALGSITAGGVIENIQPIGSSSVPGLAGSGRVDIGLSVWPFPVDGAVLAGLGYHPVNGFAPDALQRYENANGQVQLWLVNAETPFLEHAVLIRDYLSHSEAARQDFLANRAGKSAFFTRILPDAQRWWVAHHGFAPLEAIAAAFLGTGEAKPADFPWYH